MVVTRRNIPPYFMLGEMLGKMLGEMLGELLG